MRWDGERRDRRRVLAGAAVLAAGASLGSVLRGRAQETPAAADDACLAVEVYPVPAGHAPHDVAPAADGGGVWYTAQRAGALGLLDPATGEVETVPLGEGSSPHGVVVGPDGAAWVTDSGLNAVVRVDAASRALTGWPLTRPNANLNTGAFGADGTFWFTGQGGVVGRLRPGAETVETIEAPRGTGPYGIDATPDGDIYYVSLAGSYLGRIVPDGDGFSAEVLDPPTPEQGARRVWADSAGRLWVSEWNAGQVGRYDPADGSWREWRLLGAAPQAYAVYVDERDDVWLSDFGANTLVRFDPETETFASVPLGASPANVRQILGRPGEVWGAASARDELLLVRTACDATG